MQCNIWNSWLKPKRLCVGIRVFSWFVFLKCFLCVSALFLSVTLSCFVFTVTDSSLVIKIGHREIVLQQHSLKLTNYTCIKRLSYFLAFCFQTCLLWAERSSYASQRCSARRGTDRSDRHNRLEIVVAGIQHYTRKTYQSASLSFWGWPWDFCWSKCRESTAKRQDIVLKPNGACVGSGRVVLRLYLLYRRYSAALKKVLLCTSCYIYINVLTWTELKVNFSWK